MEKSLSLWIEWEQHTSDVTLGETLHKFYWFCISWWIIPHPLNAMTCKLRQVFSLTSLWTRQWGCRLYGCTPRVPWDAEIMARFTGSLFKTEGIILRCLSHGWQVCTGCWWEALICSFIHSFIHSFVHSFAHPSIHLSIHWFFFYQVSLAIRFLNIYKRYSGYLFEKKKTLPQNGYAILSFPGEQEKLR